MTISMNQAEPDTAPLTEAPTEAHCVTVTKPASPWSPCPVPDGGHLLTAGLAGFVAASVAGNTRAAYAADWARFAAWCARRGVDPMTATGEEVAAWIAQAATALTPDGAPVYRPSTLARWVSGVNQVHAARRDTAAAPPGRSELVRRTLAGIRRTRATPPVRRRPLHLAELATITTTAHQQATSWPDKVRAARDCAILLIGHLGAMRGAELAALAMGDVALDEAGAAVTVRQGKTDPDAQGLVKALRRTTNPAVCPLCAWHAWRSILDAHAAGGRPALIAALLNPQKLDAHGHLCSQPLPPTYRPQDPALRWLGRHGWPTDRPITADAIRDVVLSRAAKAGLPPHIVKKLGAHSLRAGFVTDAFAAGASDGEVMRQTGHRSVAQVRAYQRDAPHIGNAVTRLDLP